MATQGKATAPRLRVLAVAVLVIAALCAFTAGVLAKYVGTSTDKTVSIGVVNQWSSDDVDQAVFPVDVYMRAYVTTGKTATSALDGTTVIDGTTSLVTPTSADASWQALSGDPFCFYYVGDDGIVTGGEAAPTLSLANGGDYKIVYEYLEAGLTDGGKLTCQAAWGVTIGAGMVTASRSA